jgi:hypothetical protein
MPAMRWNIINRYLLVALTSGVGLSMAHACDAPSVGLRFEAGANTLDGANRGKLTEFVKTWNARAPIDRALIVPASPVHCRQVTVPADQVEAAHPRLQSVVTVLADLGLARTKQTLLLADCSANIPEDISNDFDVVVFGGPPPGFFGCGAPVKP